MVFSRVTRLLLLAALSCVAATAQVRGDLQGRVLDTSGAAVPSARIELVETATGIRRQMTSSGSGAYSFSGLNPGEYRLNVSAGGFQKLVRTGVIVAVGQTAGLDLTLAVGADQ